MLAYIEKIEAAMEKFGGLLGLVIDGNYRQAAAFYVDRINMLSRWFSADFIAEYPELYAEMEPSKPDSPEPDTRKLWGLLQNEIPRRKDLLKRLIDEHALLTRGIDEWDFPPPARVAYL